MPTYVYSCPCGKEQERTVPMIRRARRVRCDCGAWARRDIAAEQRPRRAVSCSNWPLRSDAAGVHPSQVPEVMAACRARGVPTEFTRDGRAILTGPAHRRTFCELRGLYDRNGGYGDPKRK